MGLRATLVFFILGLVAGCLRPHSASGAAPALCGDPLMTAQGAVRGHEEGGSCAFKGIPYAAPPTGALRWRAPEAPAPWTGIRDGGAFPPRCLQKSVMELVNFDPSGASSEDCLYLNVWRPEGEGPFPVFVWIHGGGLFGGTANTPMYHGAALAEAGKMIVVTFNYRLAVFGFLASEAMAEEDPDGSAGNYGLQDQLAALEWVQENIHAFGGDKDRVTLAGESAGGWSVCALMASPLGEGLFHQAIMESGGCRAVTTLERGYEIGARVAEELGCDASDLACMRAAPAKRVLRRGVQSELQGFEWLPRIDGHVLTEAPLDTIHAGRHKNIPFLAGGNRDEAGVIVALRPGQYFHADGRYGARLDAQFGVGVGSELSEVYRLDDFQRPIRAYRQIATDAALLCPSIDSLRLSATAQPKSYLYRFDFDDFRFGRILGAPHGFEVSFVFGTLHAMPTGPLFWGRRRTEEAQPLADTMMAYWSNFVWRGDPNGEGLPPWPSFGETGSVQLLDAEVASQPMDDRVVKRCDFWHTYAGLHPELAETLGFTFGGPPLRILEETPPEPSHTPIGPTSSAP